MRASRFVVGLATLLLSAQATATAQYQPEPTALSASVRPTATTTTAHPVTGVSVAAAEVAVADATRQSAVDPRKFADPRVAAADGMGRISYVLIGAVVGAATVYGLGLAVRVMTDCVCNDSSLGIAAGGGAVLGGFIGSVAFGMRRDQGGQPRGAANR